VLFRSILRVHKDLPPEMRDIGDKYVKAEFKAMKAAKKEEHVAKFMKQWQDYLNTLAVQFASGKIGKDINSIQQEKLSQEQQFQLKRIRNAVDTNS